MSREMHLGWLCIALCFALAFPAAAQLTASPVILEPEVYPGGIKRFEIDLSNSTEETLECSVRKSGLRIGEGGRPVVAPDAKRSCAEWLSFDAESFRLEGGRNRTLNCRLNPPRGVSGGYYAVVEIEGRPTEQASPSASGVQAGIRLSYRVMAVVLVTVRGSSAEAVIEALTPRIRVGDGGAWDFAVPVRNNGNIHVQMEGHVEIRSETGLPLVSFDLAAVRGFLLPDHERVFSEQISLNLPDGVYAAHVQLERQGQTRPMAKQFAFYVNEGKPEIGELPEEMRLRLTEQSAGFRVEPSALGVALRPGARRTQALTVTNLTRETIPLRVHAAEWVRQTDGSDVVGEEAPAHGRSVAEWISIPREEIELRPLSKARIPFIVALPSGWSGEGYAALQIDRSDRALSDAPDQTARRSARIRAMAPKTQKPSAELLDFTADRTPAGAVALRALLRNTGETGLLPDVAVSIQNLEGAQVARLTLPDLRASLVQAGGERLIQTEHREILEPGEYTAVMTVHSGSGAQPLSARAPLVIPHAPETADESRVTTKTSGETEGS